ncbi:hypothetical protein STEG23_023589 [Scotinomys teguina]
MSGDHSLFGGPDLRLEPKASHADRFEPLRVIMRGGLKRKNLQTPPSENGSSTEMGEGASPEQVESKDVYNARQFGEKGTRPPSAPDTWGVVASAHCISISQPQPSRSLQPIRRALFTIAS